ncbi:hypothetical protein N657DRAFT_326748 [Parathielavia appendiculata]|uniref:Uncharacterized protein n=1 Tax=Parathielavia appendiculata TaxID=2587402 RepID=A0AAN6TQF8_9PEZI|nr:hypothetical protein N657DRAFT_326748 [Parathielavia appendiculata]
MSKGTDNLALELLTGELPESSRTSDYILDAFGYIVGKPTATNVPHRSNWVPKRWATTQLLMMFLSVFLQKFPACS